MTQRDWAGSQLACAPANHGEDSAADRCKLVPANCGPATESARPIHAVQCISNATNCSSCMRLCTIITVYHHCVSSSSLPLTQSCCCCGCCCCCRLALLVWMLVVELKERRAGDGRARVVFSSVRFGSVLGWIRFDCFLFFAALFSQLKPSGPKSHGINSMSVCVRCPCLLTHSLCIQPVIPADCLECAGIRTYLIPSLLISSDPMHFSSFRFGWDSVASC